MRRLDRRGAGQVGDRPGDLPFFLPEDFT